MIRLCAAAAAATGAAVTVLVRCRNRECGHGARIVVGQLTAHVGLERFVLGCLRCRKLCCEQLLTLLSDLCVLCLDALCGQGVKDGAGVLVLVVDDVPGGVLHRVPGLAGLSGQIVVDALNGRAVLAAALLLLHLHGQTAAA